MVKERNEWHARILNRVRLYNLKKLRTVVRNGGSREGSGDWGKESVSKEGDEGN